MLAETGRYTFRVHPDAHKTEIRQAIKTLFEVDVVSVHTANVRGKPKRRGLYSGNRRSWKKAIVQVGPGQKIPIFQALETS